MTSTDLPRPTVAEVLDKLATQGSARQIADHLLSEGCLGNRGNSTACPVARWVRRQTGEQITIRPSTWGIFVNPTPGASEGLTPDEVGDFIAEFDAGAYPELDRHRQPRLGGA